MKEGDNFLFILFYYKVSWSICASDVDVDISPNLHELKKLPFSFLMPIFSD